MLAISTRQLFAHLPGLAVTGGIAAASFAIAPLLNRVLSPLILAILIGVAIRAMLGPLPLVKTGSVFAQKKLLRLAIILLGLQISVSQLLELGATGLIIVLLVVAATMIFMIWLAQRLGLDPRLGALIAAGTSICGASAVIATGNVVQGREEDVAYALGIVTLFGSIAMFVYPLLQPLLGLGAQEYGFWAGASIHEVAQVAAATYHASAEAGEFGLITKLARVILLAPMLVLLGYWINGRGGSYAQNAPFPWFVIGFIAMIAVNSLIALSPDFKFQVARISSFLLTVALAGLGMELHMRGLMAAGARPLLVGALGTLFIALLSLALLVALR
jgi:uncharacterized integral membrane protein (TIGR00698 family)